MKTLITCVFCLASFSVFSFPFIDKIKSDLENDKIYKKDFKENKKYYHCLEDYKDAYESFKIITIGNMDKLRNELKDIKIKANMPSFMEKEIYQGQYDNIVSKYLYGNANISSAYLRKKTLFSLGHPDKDSRDALRSRAINIYFSDALTGRRSLEGVFLSSYLNETSDKGKEIEDFMGYTYFYNSDLYKLKDKDRLALFSKCKTKNCIVMLADVYKAWVDLAKKHNKKIKLGNIKLKKFSYHNSERKLKAQIDEVAFRASKNLPSIDLSKCDEKESINVFDGQRDISKSKAKDAKIKTFDFDHVKKQ